MLNNKLIAICQLQAILSRITKLYLQWHPHIHMVPIEVNDYRLLRLKINHHCHTIDPETPGAGIVDVKGPASQT